jgi:hypothetical protein
MVSHFCPKVVKSGRPAVVNVLRSYYVAEEFLCCLETEADILAMFTQKHITRQIALWPRNLLYLVIFNCLTGDMTGIQRDFFQVSVPVEV